MDVTTANRFHVGEIILSSLLRIPAILIFGAHLWELLVYELMMFPVVQFHHANIGIPERLDKLLRIFIVTPAMHKVHHSRIKPETNSNYTSLLSVWDRIFGSFRLRANPHEISFGLDEFDATKHQTLTGLITTPLIDASDNERQEE
jgi:sterol desaturase/sphingolipid hydroxylase (fatty acid hydroxylase superfamily)